MHCRLNDNDIKSLSLEDQIHLLKKVTRIKPVDSSTATQIALNIFLKLLEPLKTDLRGAGYSKHQFELTSGYVRKLLAENRFDRTEFMSQLLRNDIVSSLVIVWLLEKADVFNLHAYIAIKKPPNIIDDIIELLTDNSKTAETDLHEHIDGLPRFTIGCELLLEIVTGFCPSMMSILPDWDNWQEIYDQYLDEFVLKTLDSAIRNEPSLARCLSFLSSSGRLTVRSFEAFCKRILEPFLTYRSEENVRTVLMFQELWTYGQIPIGLLNILKTVMKAHRLEDVVQIVLTCGESINWKHTLMAVSVCIKDHPDGDSELKSIVDRFIESTFSNGKFNEFLFAILLARQGCLEETPSFCSYNGWYSAQFGINTVFKTSRNEQSFQHLITSLTDLLPYEPTYCLKVHVDRSLRLPPHCQAQMFTFKNMCRARLEELRQSPTINIHNVDVSVRHILEDCQRNGRLSDLLVQHCESVPLLKYLQESNEFETVKRLLANAGCNLKPIEAAPPLQYNDDSDYDDVFQ